MIVHLLLDEKFTSDFINLVDDEFNQNNEHVFLIITKHQKLRYEIKSKADIVFVRQDIRSLFCLVRFLCKADAIIAHGIFNPYLVCILFFLRVSHKVVWAIWGGDLYEYNNERGVYKFVKRSVIRHFSGAVTPVPGDVVLASKVYGFKGKYYPCMLYLSNIISDIIQDDASGQHEYTILIGNSADDSNRHEYILRKIKPLRLDNTKIILPLSYGKTSYADHIEQLYKAEFGENAICLREFMPKEEYLKLLSSVDTVLFAHKRQQGIGNLIQLINYGAKVYLEPFVTTYEWLSNLGIKTYSIEEIDESVLIPLNEEEKSKNKEIIHSVASKEALIRQLADLFNNLC